MYTQDEVGQEGTERKPYNARHVNLTYGRLQHRPQAWSGPLMVREAVGRVQLQGMEFKTDQAMLQ